MLGCIEEGLSSVFLSYSEALQKLREHADQPDEPISEFSFQYFAIQVLRSGIEEVDAETIYFNRFGEEIRRVDRLQLQELESHSSWRESGKFLPESIVVLEPWPYNLHSPFVKPVCGLLGEKSEMSSTTFSFVFDYVDPVGYWDHCHLPESAFREAHAEEARSAPTFLRLLSEYATSSESASRDIKEAMSLALRRVVPVAGLSSLDGLVERVKTYNLESW